MDDDDDRDPRPRREETSPIIRLIEGDLDAATLALANRLRRRGGGDTELTLARVIRALERDREESGSQLESQLGAAIHSQDRRLADLEATARELKATIADYQRALRWARSLGGMAIGIALAVAGFVIERVLDGDGVRGEQRIRIEHLERAMERVLDQRWSRPTTPAP